MSSPATTYEQRAFDLMRASPHLLSIEDLAKRMRVDRDVVAHAMDRLQRKHVITAVCQDKQWRYGVKASAERPADKRGGTHRIKRRTNGA